jgi:lysophospholipase L1-like esterase
MALRIAPSLTRAHAARNVLTALTLSFGLLACGGGDQGSSAAASTSSGSNAAASTSSGGSSGTSSGPYNLGGTVTGLGTGESVTLSSNSQTRVVSANGSFVFATKLTSGTSYSVSTSSPPSGKTCNASNASGTISADVSNVSITCFTASSSTSTPIKLPVISRSKPAYAQNASYPASQAVDANYGTTFRTTSALGWLAVDLSTVTSTQRKKVLVAWYSPTEGSYDYSVSGQTPYNQPKDYTIDVNTGAGGGAAPTSGWVTLATVTANTKHSRQHVVDMTGYNWIRMNVTASNGSTGNFDADFNLDVHDASLSNSAYTNNTMDGDSWIFYGDSITAGAFGHATIGSTGNFSQLINAGNTNFFPSHVDAGVGGWKTTDLVSRMDAWLALFPGRYVAINFGTNHTGDCSASGQNTFYNEYLTLVDKVIAAGKVPVVPKMPWAPAAAVQSCGPSFNTKIDQLYAARTQIIPGPDLWSVFLNKSSWFADTLHPNDTGYAEYRKAWANAMLAVLY